MLKYVSAAVLLAVTLGAQAGVYKCQDESGKLSFSSAPCPVDSTLIDHRLSEREQALIQAEQQRKAVEAEWEAKVDQYKAEQAELEKQKEAEQAELEKQQQEALIRRAEAIQQELGQWARASNTGKVANTGWDNRVYQVEMYLEKVLKDPDSFEAIEWGPVWTKSGREYRVRCKYRAKNSFGGYVIADQVFVMNSQGKVFKSVEYAGKHIALH